MQLKMQLIRPKSSTKLQMTPTFCSLSIALSNKSIYLLHLQLITGSTTQYLSNAISLLLRQCIGEVDVKCYVQIAKSTSSSSTGHALTRHAHDVIAFGNSVYIHCKFVSV